MKQTIFYQASLPRAGSTLLQNLVGQNPKFHVTPTSGMIDIMLGARIGYNEDTYSKAEDTEQRKKCFYSFCTEGLKGYVSALTDKPYILDKNRVWSSYYSLLNEIMPNPKIIYMVRDLRAVFASMEKKFRANPDINDGTRNNNTLEGITTQLRVEKWAVRQPIGYSINNLSQSFLEGYAQNFFFIRYEDLCNNPEPVLKDMYEFLELDYFKHNFKNIPQITVEDDTVHGIYGDHTIRNTLEMLPDDSKEILGDFTQRWIYDNFKWFFDTFKYEL